jgi:hypothetical protein
MTTILALTTLLLLSNSGPSAADDASERTTLFVRVLDYARVPGPMRSARDQVTRIFAAAAVSVNWTVDPADARAVDVLVLSNAMADRKIRAESIPAGVLGVAAHSARRVYILAERVISVANRVGVEPGDALGDVIAHELGHLLLGENGHAGSGIMAPDYAIQNKAPRRFTNDQAALIRAHLLRRP